MPCVAHPTRTRPSRRGDGGNVAVPSKKEAAAEEARVRALGFELWSKVRKLEDAWMHDPLYVRGAFLLASWDTCVESLSPSACEFRRAAPCIETA